MSTTYVGDEKLREVTAPFYRADIYTDVIENSQWGTFVRSHYPETACSGKTRHSVIWS